MGLLKFMPKLHQDFSESKPEPIKPRDLINLLDPLYNIKILLIKKNISISFK